MKELPLSSLAFILTNTIMQWSWGAYRKVGMDVTPTKDIFCHKMHKTVASHMSISYEQFVLRWDESSRRYGI